jgi:hypothetical protein
MFAIAAQALVATADMQLGGANLAAITFHRGRRLRGPPAAAASLAQLALGARVAIDGMAAVGFGRTAGGGGAQGDKLRADGRSRAKLAAESSADGSGRGSPTRCRAAWRRDAGLGGIHHRLKGGTAYHDLVAADFDKCSGQLKANRLVAQLALERIEPRGRLRDVVEHKAGR